MGFFGLLVLLAFAVSCGASYEPASGNNAATLWADYLPWDEGLSQLDPSTVAWVTGFAAAIPSTIPEYALPQVQFPVQQATSQSNDDGLGFSADADGMVRTRFVVGNPSNRPNRSQSVICLRNQEQVPCAPGVELWTIEVPGRSMAFLPLEIVASTGDRIDVLLIPRDQAGYPFSQSIAYPLFVGRRTALDSSEEIDGSSRVWPFEGCGFARILAQEPPITTQTLPVGVGRDGPLYLLIELCDPGEVVRLVAIGDRRVIVAVPHERWAAPMRILGTTALIRIDPSWFADVDEFQVLVIRDTFGQGRGPSAWFSDAVTFAD